MLSSGAWCSTTWSNRTPSCPELLGQLREARLHAHVVDARLALVEQQAVHRLHVRERERRTVARHRDAAADGDQAAQTEVHRGEHASRQAAHPGHHAEHGARRLAHHVERGLVVDGAIEPPVTTQPEEHQHGAEAMGLLHDRRRRAAEHDAHGPVDRRAERAFELGAHRAPLIAVHLRAGDGVAHRERHVERGRNGRGARVHDGEDVDLGVMLLRECVRDVRCRDRARRAVGGEQHDAAGEIELPERLRRGTGLLVHARGGRRRVGRRVDHGCTLVRSDSRPTMESDAGGIRAAAGKVGRCGARRHCTIGMVARESGSVPRQSRGTLPEC